MSDANAVRWKGSQEYWEKLAEIYAGMFRKNPRSRIFVPLADALYHAGMASSAIDILEAGLALQSNNRAGMILLARLKSDAGDKNGASVLLHDVVERWPDATAAVTMLCKFHENNGLYDEAEKISSALLDYFPDSKQVARLHGKYKALAAGRLDVTSDHLPRPAYEAGEPVAVNEPETVVEQDEMEKTRLVSDIEEFSPADTGLLKKNVIVSSTATDLEDYSPPQEETAAYEMTDEKTDTRTRKRRSKAAYGESSERQLTLIKLESMLSGITKLRK